MKIDSHQHFWIFNPARDTWIDDNMKLIRRNFLPQDLQPVLQAAGFDGCVTVQSDQSELENDFQLNHAAKNDFIKGVIGWVDLTASNVEERLAHYRQYEKMKGFRHVLQGEADRAFMLTGAFKNGINKLNGFNYTYDILVHNDQLKHVLPFVAAFPDQPLVLDHMGKPDIKKQEIEQWAKDIKAISKFENVYCKISGMVTEADWLHWQHEDLLPYIDVVVQSFGTKRIMYGSDWPVCLVAADYGEAFNIAHRYFLSFSAAEKAAVFGENAARFYRL